MSAFEEKEAQPCLVVPQSTAGGKRRGIKAPLLSLRDTRSRLTRRRSGNGPRGQARPLYPEAVLTNWLASPYASPNTGLDSKPSEGPSAFRSGLRGGPSPGQLARSDPAWVLSENLLWPQSEALEILREPTSTLRL